MMMISCKCDSSELNKKKFVIINLSKIIGKNYLSCDDNFISIIIEI